MFYDCDSQPECLDGAFNIACLLAGGRIGAQGSFDRLEAKRSHDNDLTSTLICPQPASIPAFAFYLLLLI